MTRLKLRTKILLLTSCLIVIVILGSFYLINQVVEDQVRNRLVRGLEGSQLTLEQAQKGRLRQLVAYSIIASENSTLKAAIDTYQLEQTLELEDQRQLKRTIENEAAKLFQILDADLLVITSNKGQVLAIEGVADRREALGLDLSQQSSVANSLQWEPLAFAEAASIWRFSHKLYRVVSVPVLLGDLVVGTLTTGFKIDQELLNAIKNNTGSDVVFLAGEEIVASTLSTDKNRALLRLLADQGSITSPKSSTHQPEITLDDEFFLASTLHEGDSGKGQFVVLNSIDQAVHPSSSGVRNALIVIGLVSTLLATVLGLALAQSISQPLAYFVKFMETITRTGDLKHRFQPVTPNYEVDVLSRAFESMAQSLDESRRQTAAVHERLRQKETNEEKLRLLATRSHLDALISQVNPHFLFNALNTVKVLIDEHPQVAHRLTVKLANIFRRTLKASEREMISLQEELSFIRDYLEIERARFGERLLFEQAITVREAFIPCFTLQPLIENAIKHGASPKIGPTTISITIHKERGRLLISVADNGMGMSPQALSSILSRGYGLQNLLDRLQILYQSDFSWRVKSKLQEGTQVFLDLPFQLAG